MHGKAKEGGTKEEYKRRYREERGRDGNERERGKWRWKGGADKGGGGWVEGLAKKRRQEAKGEGIVKRGAREGGEGFCESMHNKKI